MPLGLAGLVCSVLLLGLVFRLGQRGLQQERVRMRADVTAYSGGVQLARCLNLISYSEKLRTILQDAVVTEGFAAALGEFQNAFIYAAPWVVEADTIFIGYRNEILTIPIWNQQDMAGSSALSGLFPKLKVSKGGTEGSGRGSNQASSQDSRQGTGQNSGESGQSRTGSGIGTYSFSSLGTILGDLNGSGPGSTDSSNANSAGGGTGSGSAYHYESNDGELHELDQNQASEVDERGAHGTTVTRYKDNKTHKYVSKSSLPQSGMGLTDQGGHYLGIWAIQSPKAQSPGWVLTCSQVRVAGGDVDAMDFSHGADYRPFFVPVRGDSQDGTDDQDGSQSKGSADYSGFFSLARGLGMDLGPVQAFFNAGSRVLEIQH
jgi:hypothetical protein